MLLAPAMCFHNGVHARPQLTVKDSNAFQIGILSQVRFGYALDDDDDDDDDAFQTST